jgi:hypothetical protein
MKIDSEITLLLFFVSLMLSGGVKAISRKLIFVSLVNRLLHMERW